MSLIVSPSLLSADFANLTADLEMINDSDAAWLHLDVMDGVFVPNISFGFPVIAAVARHCTKFLDAHFMIVNPERYVKRAAECGVHMMTVHAEAADNLVQCVEDIHAAGMKAGVAVNPETDIAAFEPVIDMADMFLVMSVHPGFSGQSFIEGSVEKVAALKKRLTEAGSNALIQVDGGVNGDNAPVLMAAGADVVVCGNYVFKAANPKATISALVALKA